MAQNPYQHPMDGAAVEASPRVSAMAVASLVFGLLCCIPISGLIGTILGGAAMVSISRSEGRLSGRGMAVSGLILGALGTMLWIGMGAGTLWFMKEMGRFTQPIQAITTGDYATARQQLSTSTASKLTDARAKEFSEELKALVGAPKGMPKGIGDWISGFAEIGDLIQGAQGSAPRNVAAVPVPVHFEKEVALVMVYLEEGKSKNGLPPIKNISIHTKSGKTLWLVPPDSGP